MVFSLAWGIVLFTETPVLVVSFTLLDSISTQ